MWLALLISCGTVSTGRAPPAHLEPPSLLEPPPPAAPERELVDVSHRRELRGAWIATVSNINWPSRSGLGVDQQRAELLEILDTCAAAGLNAVFLQVRPESDALYASDLEPWSRYLTGTQGEDPGWDPLAFATAAAHARGLELHAWFNPYRAKAFHRSAAHESHVSHRFANRAHRYGTLVWMDPGAPEVQDHLVAVIRDVLLRYDIDGIHFDDYFYPYPDGSSFPDAASYAAHGSGLSLADWRRHNVNAVVSRIAAVVAAEKPWVRWGVSPFGIYRPGQPAGITGLDQYDAIYADPVTWKAMGWVDYLAPQLYWPSTQAAQAYGPLLTWWAEQPGDAYTFAGGYLAKLGSSPSWTVDELRRQVALTRAQAPHGGLGTVWFHVGPLLDDTNGIRQVFANELYATPALPPPVQLMADEPLAPPEIADTASGVSLQHATARWWVLYEEVDGQFHIRDIFPADHAEIELGRGRWAITAAGPHGVESSGIVSERP